MRHVQCSIMRHVQCKYKRCDRDLDKAQCIQYSLLLVVVHLGIVLTVEVQCSLVPMALRAPRAAATCNVYVCTRLRLPLFSVEDLARLPKALPDTLTFRTMLPI